MRGDPLPVDLVPATVEHREFVRELSADVFARFGDYETMLTRWMIRPGVRTVIARLDGEAIGFSIYLCSPGEREVELLAIAVAPAWQFRGVGRRMLAHMEREAKRLALTDESAWVRLTVAEDNVVARGLFERSGYERVEGENGFYPAGQRALNLRKRVQ